MTMRQAAANQLADGLEAFAAQLASAGLKQKRVPYGRGLAGGPIKPRSPKGLVLDSVAPQLLLADGRLWYYHSRLNPNGIYYSARTDHVRSEHGSIPIGRARFSFLGAVVHKYHFGYRYQEGADGPSDAFELGAIIDKSGSTTFLTAADAFADLSRILGVRAAAGTMADAATQG